jgi:hypothetical protein
MSWHENRNRLSQGDHGETNMGEVVMNMLLLYFKIPLFQVWFEKGGVAYLENIKHADRRESEQI